MALESRGHGLYFYTKRRIGKRVISEYSGSGEIGNLIYLWESRQREEQRLENEMKREAFGTERADRAEVDKVIDSFCCEANALEEALLLINGYHKHSRQWRKRRK